MTLLIVLSIIIFLIYIIIRYNKNKRNKIPISVQIGNEGEKLVNDFLSKRSEGKLINNLLIKVNGTYAQIGHIYITNTAIYVIETKNYNGKIYGKENDDKWICVYKNGSKYSLYNPIKQNNTHILRLKQLLQDDTIKIVPIIIFTNENCKFKYNLDTVYTLDEFKKSYTEILLTNITGKETFIDIKEYYDLIMKYDLSKNRRAVENQKKFANKARYS